MVNNIITEIIKYYLIQEIIKNAILVAVIFIAIRANGKHIAKKNAEAFNYDYLAKRIAEETCKRLMIIERQKEENAAHHEPDTQPAEAVPARPALLTGLKEGTENGIQEHDQQHQQCENSSRDGAPELNDNRQE